MTPEEIRDEIARMVACAICEFYGAKAATPLLDFTGDTIDRARGCADRILAFLPIGANAMSEILAGDVVTIHGDIEVENRSRRAAEGGG